jgi:hypothetical protein
MDLSDPSQWRQAWREGRRACNTKPIAVLAGAKSAYNAVHQSASHGVKVEWIIRRSSRGATWVIPACTKIRPFKAWREKLVTRQIIGPFSSCINSSANDFGWPRMLIHGTKLRKAFAGKFWPGMHEATLEDCGYAGQPTTKLLEPETDPCCLFGRHIRDLYLLRRFLQNTSMTALYGSNARISRLSAQHRQPRQHTTLPTQTLITTTDFESKPTIGRISLRSRLQSCNPASQT